MVTSQSDELIIVEEGISSPLLQDAPELKRKEFPDNLDLVYALGKHLHIDQKVILNGIRQAKFDIGKFKIWKYRSPETQKTCYCVNGFAANDPESTVQVITKVIEILPPTATSLIGLLSLRSDRGDRTKQWLKFLSSGAFEGFSRIYVTGAHAKIAGRKLKSASILKNKPPETMMRKMMAEIDDRAVIFGFGNMKGAGELMVDHWNQIGEVYEL
jgi:hypothetical protein